LNNNFLKSQLNKLQNEYCNILEKSLEKLSTDDFSFIADEVNLFWYRHRKIVQLIFDNFASLKSDTLLFTGTTYIDIADKELYPFMLLGDEYIIDDSFSNLSSFTINMPNIKFKIETQEKLIQAAKDNIEIIKNYPNIYILPVSFLTKPELEYINEKATEYFLGLYSNDNIQNIKEYFDKYKNLEDAINGIPQYLQEQIMVTEYDNDSSLLERYLVFKNSPEYPFPDEVPEVFAFYCIINAYIMRALMILEMSFSYNFVPYLRYPVIFQYFALLGYKYNSHPVYGQIVLKGICSHLLHKYFDKEKFAQINFTEFYNKALIYGFKENLYKDLKKVNMSCNNISMSYIKERILFHLKRMFN